MKTSDTTELMHAVLDGEATPEQAHELERVLAADPAVRAQFDELQGLFDALRRVPKAYPPEGLVAAVAAALPSQQSPAKGRHQLFPKSRVIEQASIQPRGSIAGQKATIHPQSRVGSIWGKDHMSQQNSKSFGKGKIWIGAGIAAAAVLVIGQYVEFPSSGQSVSGTVAPAARFRAPQMTSDDVKVGNPSAGGAASNNPSTPSGAQGQVSQGQVSQGQVSQGQVSQGQVSQGQVSQGQVSQGQVSQGQVSQGQVSQGQVSQGQVSQGQVSQGQVSQGQVSQGQVSQGQVSQGQVSQGQVSQGQVSQGQVSQGQVSQGQVSQGQVSQGQVSQGQVSQGQVSQGQVSR